MTVGAVLGQLAAGRTVEGLLQEFPYLEREDVLAALERGGGGSSGSRTLPRRVGVRFVVDANLSPVVTAGLRAAGHDAVHVADIGLLTASDEVFLATTADDDRVIVSADADFAALLTLGHLSKPSFVLLRSATMAALDTRLAHEPFDPLERAACAEAEPQFGVHAR